MPVMLNDQPDTPSDGGASPGGGCKNAIPFSRVFHDGSVTYKLTDNVGNQE